MLDSKLWQASKCVNAKTLQLVDDVVLFGSQNSAFLAAYTRTILREMAEDFCCGRLILYPSEAALRMIMWRADEVNVYYPSTFSACLDV